MEAHNKRGEKAKWNNVARRLKGNKKGFYKYIQEKEQNREKNYKVKMLSRQRLREWPHAYDIFYSSQFPVTSGFKTE